jgi:hypothetical protein
VDIDEEVAIRSDRDAAAALTRQWRLFLWRRRQQQVRRRQDLLVFGFVFGFVEAAAAADEENSGDGG